MMYLRIDADVLDEAYVPDHGTKEPSRPGMEQVLDTVAVVMRTGKVKADAVVSICAGGSARARNVTSGIESIQGGLMVWHSAER